MKTVVICPDQRPEARMLGRLTPLALVPVLGRTFLSRWLAHLSDSGFREVIILASDRPRFHPHRGRRWRGTGACGSR